LKNLESVCHLASSASIVRCQVPYVPSRSLLDDLGNTARFYVLIEVPSSSTKSFFKSLSPNLFASNSFHLAMRQLVACYDCRLQSCPNYSTPLNSDLLLFTPTLTNDPPDPLSPVSCLRSIAQIVPQMISSEHTSGGAPRRFAPTPGGSHCLYEPAEGQVRSCAL
jgi:hypothetical protein